MSIIGIIRVRNESLIIADTIRHYLTYCDSIILYDDCSEDDTVSIAQVVGGDRIDVIHGDRWRSDRIAEDTRHRLMLTEAAKHMRADWCLCFDADERLVGELPSLGLGANAHRFRLFDGYLTKDRQSLYRVGEDLGLLPRMWGPEYRDIIILFRPHDASWPYMGARQPQIYGNVKLAPIMVKHYGKCMSIEHWEETCDYYAKYYPGFSKKWKARKGKAIHTVSDFGRELFTWDDLMTNQQEWVKI